MNRFSRRTVLVGAMAMPALMIATSSEAGVNTVFQKRVGKKMTHIFDGSAKKFVVTTLEGQVEIKVRTQFGVKNHRIRANPKRSKTILVNRGAGGPLEVQAKSVGGPSSVLLQVEVEAVTCNRPQECEVGTIGFDVLNF